MPVKNLTRPEQAAIAEASVHTLDEAAQFLRNLATVYSIRQAQACEAQSLKLREVAAYLRLNERQAPDA